MRSLEDRHKKELLSILKAYPCQFYLFGSRLRGDSRTFSDIDLCYTDKLPNLLIAELKEKLENSGLPYKVDLIDLNQVSVEFRNLIEDKMSPVEKALS